MLSQSGLDVIAAWVRGPPEKNRPRKAKHRQNGAIGLDGSRLLHGTILNNGRSARNKKR